MSKSAYILEAFKQFDSLVEEDELITSEEMPIYDANSENIHDFLDVVGDDSDISIIDLEAEAEEDLKQSYVGKVILDCNVCHSNIFIDKDEIIVDEEGVANVDLECPYCMSNEGYTIIGQVEPYSEYADDEEIEIDDEESIEIEEGLITDKEEYAKLNKLGKGVKDGSVSEHEFEVAMNQLDRMVDEGCDKDKIDECGDMPVEESMKLDGVKKLKGTKKLHRRPDKDGVKALRGRANSKISGTEDLRESYSNVEIGLGGGDDSFRTKQAFEKFLSKCEKAGITLKDVDYDDESGDWEVTLVGNGADIYRIASRVPGYNNTDMYDSPNDWIDEYRIDESLGKRNRRRVKESIEDVSVTTEDETMTMTTKEDGGVVIETSPKSAEAFDDGFEDFGAEETEFTEDEFAPEDEVIAPISDDEEDEIELNSEVDALEDEDIEALEEPEEEIDVEDFDEESFDELGESYLRKHYDNVDGFKTVNAKVFNNSLILEGVIRFTSGASKGTSFTFEAVNKKKNDVIFEGYNSQISRGKKTFKLTCNLVEGCIKPKKMSYNYMTKNELNESVRINGTCKVK